MSARAFRDIWPLVIVFRLSNCTRSCNFENFKNITAAHTSRNALAFIRFSIQITHSDWLKQRTNQSQHIHVSFASEFWQITFPVTHTNAMVCSKANCIEAIVDNSSVKTVPKITSFARFHRRKQYSLAK